MTRPLITHDQALERTTDEQQDIMQAQQSLCCTSVVKAGKEGRQVSHLQGRGCCHLQVNHKGTFSVPKNICIPEVSVY